MSGQANESDVDRLVLDYLPRLRAYVRVHMGDELRAVESCSDVVQSVVRELLRRRVEFEFRGEGAFLKWLFESARRKIIDRIRYHRAEQRERGREQRLAEDDRQQSALLSHYQSLCTPSRLLEAREAIHRVEQAIAELPDHYRQVLLLARMVGLPHAQIAEELGRSEVAVRIVLYRATRKLAKALGEDGVSS